MSDYELEDGEFTAEDILSRLREEFPAAYCNQTGGGTATLYIHKVPGDIAVTAGPGSFNWSDGNKSVFYIGEFSAGMEMYKNDGTEEREEDELGPDSPLNGLSAATPAEFDRVAKIIAEYHAIYNNGDYPPA